MRLGEKRGLQCDTALKEAQSNIPLTLHKSFIDVLQRTLNGNVTHFDVQKDQISESSNLESENRSLSRYRSLQMFLPRACKVSLTRLWLKPYL